MQISKFHYYSLGIVAANKLLSSKDIEVTPIEISPMVNGEISDSATPITATSVDANGRVYSLTSNTTNSIKATWLPIGNSNRMTSPDVRRGEVVMIYRFADTDKFYWEVHENNMDLRKLETVIYAFSDTTTEGAAIDATNSYFMEISTHKGVVHLHTSNTNGEACIYDIQLNAKTGFLQIMDDQGNFFKFDSVAGQITAANKNGSSLDINKVNINLNCVGNISMNAGGQFTLTTSKSTINSPTDFNGHVDINGGIDIN